MKKLVFIIMVVFATLTCVSSLFGAQAAKQKQSKSAAAKPVAQPSAADLVIDAKSITFSEALPMEGDAVTITATVRNRGNKDISEDIEVQFVEGNPKEGGLQIGSNTVVLGLKAGATGKVEVKWRAAPGESRIYVIVDPSNMIKEATKDNNTVIKIAKGRTWSGAKVSDAQIKESIKKGIDWLRTQQGEFYVICPNNHDNFLFSAMAYGKCVICSASLEGIEPVRAPQENMPGGWMPEIGPGLTALVVSTFLFAGINESDPAIVKGIDHLFNKAPAPWKEWSDAYDYAVLILALTATGDKEKYMEQVEFSIQKLLEFQTEDGGWGYGAMAADAAHLQYVIFGLYAAKQWGVQIPTETWTKAVAWLTRLQRPDGGWNYNGEGIGPFAVDSYGSMTATGLMGLKSVGISPSNDTVKRGIDWLLKHYTITRNPGSFYWHYYFMLAVQRAMDMPPKQGKLGEHDWYSEMASFLLSKQKSDGSWIADTPIFSSGSSVQPLAVVAWGKDRGDIMTTTFALMFLMRAMPKSAIPDVGFGPQHITFSKADPVSGEKVTIKASVSNMTEIPVENVKVSFYDGDPRSAGVHIGDAQIPALAGEETKDASVVWETKGTAEHKIYAVIDPSNSIREASKDNNIAYMQIRVGGGTAPAIPGLIEVGDGQYKLGRLDLDLKKKTITIYGKVNMSAGLIELLACTKKGKLHETVLVMDVEPIHLQTALILLGLEFGGGLRYQGDPLTPKGDRVIIWVEWESGGKTKRHRAEDLVYNRTKQASMEHTDWAFSGSRIINGTFMAQSTGTIITTYHDPYTILDNPLPDGGDDSVYIANSQVVPPKGTEVRMIITPASPS